MASSKRITQSLIAEVVDDLRNGRIIRMELPSGGALHLDRKLPFLCLCRSGSPELERFVRSEAAFIVATPRRFYQKGFTDLVRAVVRECAAEAGGFLIIELWEGDITTPDIPAGIRPPQFRIYTDKRHIPSDTIEALRNGLSRIKIQRVPSRVNIHYQPGIAHDKNPVLIPHNEQKRLNCFWVGLEVSPVYRDPQTSINFPARHRLMHRAMTHCIKQTVFTFCHAQTKLRPKTHMVLGPRGVNRSVWNCDRRLAEIAESIDFLYLVSPVNAKQAWSTFQSDKCTRMPRFFYRPIPFDTALLKRNLYRIPIDELHDPVWGYLFQQKRTELDTQLSMLRDRNTPSFHYGSLQLHGRVSAELLKTATHILEAYPVDTRSSRKTKGFSSTEVRDAAEDLVKEYQSVIPEFTAKVTVRDDITGLLVSKNQLYIGELKSVPDHRIRPLLEHEVGTHILTYFNACCQPLALLRHGLPGYDELQEGLAVLAEYLAGGFSINRMRLLAGRVVAVDMMVNGAPFQDVYHSLIKQFRFDKRSAFIMTMRIYRSGGLTKDAVYLKGLVQIMKHLQSGQPFKELLVGKFHFQHLQVIRELTARRVLQPPTLLPRYLETPEGVDRLAAVRNGLPIIEMIKDLQKKEYRP